MRNTPFTIQTNFARLFKDSLTDFQVLLALTVENDCVCEVKRGI